MKALKIFWQTSLCLLLCFVLASAANPQKSARSEQSEKEFGPIVRAYLGYLKNQQEVVDDRVSRREVDRAYYIRNSNRIHALRRTALRIARETENDYLPELEAVAADEFNLLFDPPPSVKDLKMGEVLNYQFRFIESLVLGRDRFYVFARLDPYEQAELRKQGASVNVPATGSTSTVAPASDSATTAPRPRRVVSP